mgnify:CR=1 FL=1
MNTLNETIKRIQEVKQAREKEILSKANVVGVGVGFRQVNGKLTDTPALIVMVTQKKTPQQLPPEDILPDSIDGVPVDVQEVGEITIHSRTNED